MGRAWTHKVNVIFGGLFTRPNFFKILPKGKQKGKTKRRKKEGVFSKVVERKKVKVKKGNLKKKKKTSASERSERAGGVWGPSPSAFTRGGYCSQNKSSKGKVTFSPAFPALPALAVLASFAAAELAAPSYRRR